MSGSFTPVQSSINIDDETIKKNSSDQIIANSPPLGTIETVQLYPLYVNGSASATTSGKLTDSTATFITSGIVSGQLVVNSSSSDISEIESVDSETELSLKLDIMTSGDNYQIFKNTDMPKNWVIAHGQTLSDSDSPFDGEVIPSSTALSSTAKRHYKLNETSGTDLTDNGSDGSDATTTATVNQAGKLDKCVLIPDYTKTVTIPTLSLSGAEDFTLAFWINCPTTHTSVPNGSNLLTLNTGGSNFNGSLGQYPVSTNVSYKLNPYFQFNSDANLYISSGSTLLVNTWYHLILTYKATTGVVNKYINASLDATGTYTSSTGLNSGDMVFIGGSSTRNFSAKLDDIRFYDRVLTTEEIDALYNSGTGTESGIAQQSLSLVKIK